jgi:hypothetical protein
MFEAVSADLGLWQGSLYFHLGRLATWPSVFYLVAWARMTGLEAGKQRSCTILVLQKLQLSA